MNFLSLLVAVWVLVFLQRTFPDNFLYNAAAACGVLAGLIAAGDLFVRKVYRRESAGLAFGGGRASPARVALKLLALVFTLGVIAFAYWLFPEYNGSFYDPFHELLGTVGPWLLALAIPYFWLIDRSQLDPEDSYCHLGKLLVGKTRPDWRVLRRHFGGWAIKAFFLPLMIVYLSQELHSVVGTVRPALNYGGLSIYDFFYHGIFMVDVIFASIGYCMTFRLFDSHIRSVEPTGLGAGAALVCYQPFWSLIYGQYLQYDEGLHWGPWLDPYPWVQALWAGLIIALLCIYVLSTISFGVRFSNLTHRGIITGGPYRFTKHPAYIAKNISWWLISVPFVSSDLSHALQGSIMLGIVNVIYLVRAKTEERHLSWDPVYRDYAAWIQEHGLFAVLRRRLARLIPVRPRPDTAQ